ncbi:hypothetical protein OK016_28200 [Vibrio chagasii]|nr:hypothetical protein [Vibrio chagasii]
MAKIVGGITTSRSLQLVKQLRTIYNKLNTWKPLFDAYPPIHHWLDEVQPDVAVVFITITA